MHNVSLEKCGHRLFGPTYDFSCPESSSEPGIVTKLASTYPAPGKVLRKTAHGGDKRGLVTPAAHDSRA